MAYAIIDISGRQYRVEKGDSVVVDRVDAEPGAKLSPKAIMFADGAKTIIDGPEVDKIKVDAVVSEHLKGDKVRVFKYKAKKRYRVTTGHRSALTRLEITGLSGPGGAAKAPAGEKPKPPAHKPKPAAEEPKPAAEKPKPKKPAPKKPAAKKPEPPKPAAAKKPAPKKPAPKKPAPKKDG